MSPARRPGPQVIPRPPGVRPGAPAPWPARDAPITLDDVRAAFSGHPPGQESRTTRDGATLTTSVPSAVLVPLFHDGPDGPSGTAGADAGAARVLLTRRAAHLRSHTGQVAFPGGRLDHGEEPLAAALREAAEEVGLDPVVCEIIGELSPLTTISSGTSIVPFVAVLPGRPVVRPNPAEVDRVFDVTLSELADPEVYREEIWPIPGAGPRSMYLYELDGDTVWGATARMLTELLDIVLGGPGLPPQWPAPAEGPGRTRG